MLNKFTQFHFKSIDYGIFLVFFNLNIKNKMIQILINKLLFYFFLKIKLVQIIRNTVILNLKTFAIYYEIL